MEYKLGKLFNILIHILLLVFTIILVVLSILPFIVIPASECGMGIIILIPIYCAFFANAIWLSRITINIHRQNCKSIYLDLKNYKLILKLSNNNIVNIPFTEVANIIVKVGYIAPRGSLYDIRYGDIGDIKIETNNGEIYNIMTEFSIEFYEDFPIEYKKKLVKQFLYNP